ncbi:ATP-dependent DNA helicase PIF1 [Araneus ventricosus]|uniref:ATP-dependent DNA helicase n=1 Tax=Araneus ventricosus TaxID=182803 RepID=A0A4Y2FCZ1_ARAVE|nr:ATP-dependent DNA helicase PIF1 [Araneus ventricosus]
MGRKKLPPEEAQKRIRESVRKSKQRPEAKEKHREAERKRRAKKLGKPQSTETTEKQMKRKAQKLECQKISRSDPVKYQRELALQRERRKRKVTESLTNTVIKRLRLDSESQPSTSSCNPILCEDSNPITEKLWDKAQSDFFKNISDGPIHRCICCDRLWFGKSMVCHTKRALQNKKVDTEIIKCIFPPLADEGQFCTSCMSYIRLGKVPPLAVSNGFKYPEQPNCLAVLNDLEERLVSLRIPFMQIKECSYDRQLGIKGTIVNVPINLDQTVSKLPKNINDTATVHVKLKKRLHYKSDYMYRIINPQKVFKAASYLMKTPLYQSQDVSLDLEWLQKFENECFDPGNNCVVDMVDSESEEEEIEGELNMGSGNNCPNEMTDSANEEETIEIDDIDWENDPFENNAYLNPEPVETVVQGDVLTKMGIALAPGENKVPVSLVFDDLGEELSYPKIYCGQVRYFTRTKPPTYAEIIKSELRRWDRRGATPQKILYSHQKLLHQKLLSCISIQLRHKVFDEDQITAKNLTNPDFVHNLQYKNLAFKFMKNIKSSPAHWAQEKSRVCAQIRQFGFPTIFLTLSAAENRWFDLIKHLIFIRDNRILTESEFQTMTTTSKNELISKDPVICALYFEHKVKELWKTFSCKEGPFGNFKITHFYQRTEFQQRGSPHFHVMLWLGGAPQFDGTNTEEVEKFIDTLMTCSGKHPFSQVQRHKHTFTCLKKTRQQDNEYCRFNIPFFPMDRTRILLPLAFEDKERDPKKFKRIREFLTQLELKELSLKGATFKEFLQHLNMSHEEYFLAIRSGINRPTVFLSRNVDDVLINSYNPKILSLMQANMDIQFILDEYAVVSYLVDYINKPGRGLSRILRNCVEAVSSQKSSLKECLTAVANQFINSVEISAQEAAWSILELPMSKMSEDSIFIPTFRQEERTRMVKSQDVLNKLDPNSRDVYESNIIDYYTKRPKSLEQDCLAKFAAWYELQKTGPEEMKLLKGNKYAKCRTKPKVLQYRKFKKSHNEDEYYREQIMLFTNWRDEKEDILSQDFKHCYNANLEEIQANRKEFVVDENLDLEEELMQRDKLRAIEENEEEITENALTTYEPVLEYDENELFGDISLDMKASYGKEFSIFQPDNKYPDDKYRELFRKCNLNQRDLVQDLKSCLRSTPTRRLHLMIQGPAGTGKSFLIDIIEQTLIRWFEKPDQDPTHPTVLKLAPTGKAASNIKGKTLHHALGIGLSKNSCLSSSSITEYAVKYSNVKCVIIDEISMVGANMYEKINAHLKLFKGNEEPFGGLHVLHFGDFNQLPPVKDSPIFKERSGLNQFSPNIWHLTQFYQLDEIMRQKDDKTYAELLNRLAMGKLNDRDVQLLKTKQTTLEKVPKNATLLYHSNRDVDIANKLRLNAIVGDIVLSKAYDSVSGTASQKSKRKALKRLKEFDQTICCINIVS